MRADLARGAPRPCSYGSRAGQPAYVAAWGCLSYGINISAIWQAINRDQRWRRGVLTIVPAGPVSDSETAGVRGFCYVQHENPCEDMRPFVTAITPARRLQGAVFRTRKEC
jgi:hypothetical protein